MAAEYRQCCRDVSRRVKVDSSCQDRVTLAGMPKIKYGHQLASRHMAAVDLFFGAVEISVSINVFSSLGH
jgi:hypothetical protein